MATGSEVSLAIEAQSLLKAQGHDVSVVSMPSLELFEEQSVEYKESVLPSKVTKRLSIEMGVTYGWDRYVGEHGRMIGIDRFGASGKGEEVVDYFGFSVERIVEEYLKLSK